MTELFLLLLFAQTPNEVESVRIIAGELGLDVATATEVRLFNGRRIDLVARHAGSEYAIEADWCYKWAEGVGQSLYYGAATSRRPGLLLLSKGGESDVSNIRDANLVCAKYGIRLWIYDVPHRRWLLGSDPPDGQ